MTVLDDFQPSVSISLSYPSKHKSVSLGNTIKPKAVKKEPVFAIDASDLTATPTIKDTIMYTLVLTDPDATSRAEPVMAQMCHWIVTNITIPLSSDADSSERKVSVPIHGMSAIDGFEELMPYIPPSPPPKTGYHRYIFVLLAPTNDDDASRQLNKPKGRSHWGYGEIGAGVREWAGENHLVPIGK